MKMPGNGTYHVGKGILSRVGNLTALTGFVVVVLLLVAPVGSALATTCLGCITAACKNSRDVGSCNCVTSASCRAAARDVCELGTYCKAVVFSPGYDETADLTPNGKRIVVRGPIECTADEQIDFIRVTVTQDAAVAEGHTQGGLCTGSPTDQWEATAHAEGHAGFGAGAAKVCGVAALKSQDSFATFQWCRDITLVVEE